MAEFTKGEWQYSVLKDTQEPATLFVVDEDGVEIDIAVFEKWGDSEEQTANACLIAAAPDLYAACEDALKKLEWPIYTESEKLTMKPCRERLKAALAKARKEK